MENLGFGSKNLLFQIKKFEIPGFLHMELKIWVFDYFENLEFRLAGTEMRIMTVLFFPYAWTVTKRRNVGFKNLIIKYNSNYDIITIDVIL